MTNFERFTARTKERSDGKPGFIECEPYIRHYGDCDIYSLTPVCTCGLLMELKICHDPGPDELYPRYYEDLSKQRWMNSHAIENAILKYEKEHPTLTAEEVEVAMERMEKILRKADSPDWQPYEAPPKRFWDFRD